MFTAHDHGSRRRHGGVDRRAGGAEQAERPEDRGRAAPAQPTLLGQYADWGAYTATPEGKKVCFTLAKPKSSTTNPAGRKRDPAYVFISTRPAENVRNEISVIIGYPFGSVGCQRRGRRHQVRDVHPE